MLQHYVYKITQVSHKNVIFVTQQFIAIDCVLSSRENSPILFPPFKTIFSMTFQERYKEEIMVTKK